MECVQPYCTGVLVEPHRCVNPIMEMRTKPVPGSLVGTTF